MVEHTYEYHAYALTYRLGIRMATSRHIEASLREQATGFGQCVLVLAIFIGPSLTFLVLFLLRSKNVLERHFDAGVELRDWSILWEETSWVTTSEGR